ncbi:hypothetical protein KORDIASMS9_04710 [Kordia sp. SMS9]|uniref:DUF6261 family protein n=1 Tax=Kordia sp. SMS9 TaxID=2282170 RepID=UPI000E0DBC8D|nr:DUF6261 family protein [Kordia sp. SMS9]AXG72436.1 hypothetical protein KORDIASMS9_04710 [Kordia sp. SMS9]
METPNFSRYRNSEFLQYVKDVLELVNAQDVVNLQLTTPRDNLQAVVDQMDNLFQQEQSSGITQELIDLDERRDKAFMGLKGLLESHQHHYEEAKQLAARSLLYNLNSFGDNIPRLNYQAETAVIDSMLADWSTESILTAAVTTLGIADWVTELTAANQAFNDRFLARISESAANPALSFTTMRDNSAAVYRQLTAHIQAHATLGTNAVHQTLLNEVNELTNHYNQTVYARIRNTSNTTDTSINDEVPTDDDVVNTENV